jgi:hypothetical protein
MVGQSLNPGNLRTNLNRHTAGYLKLILNFLFVYPPTFGGYTELFAGLSPDVATADWGRSSRAVCVQNVEDRNLLTVFSSSCAVGAHLSSPRGPPSSCEDRGRRRNWSRTGVLGVVRRAGQAVLIDRRISGSF